MKKFKAFSLVELLIVIAILAMCAAMIIPIVADSHRNRQSVSFRSGDRVELIGLGAKGVIDRTYYNEATVLVIGSDGFPVKLEHVKLNILKKY